MITSAFCLLRPILGHHIYLKHICNSSANPIGPLSVIYPESLYFLPPSPLQTWSKPPSTLIWFVVKAWPYQAMSLQTLNAVYRVIFLKPESDHSTLLNINLHSGQKSPFTIWAPITSILLLTYSLSSYHSGLIIP